MLAMPHWWKPPPPLAPHRNPSRQPVALAQCLAGSPRRLLGWASPAARMPAGPDASRWAGDPAKSEPQQLAPEVPVEHSPPLPLVPAKRPPVAQVLLALLSRADPPLDKVAPSRQAAEQRAAGQRVVRAQPALAEGVAPEPGQPAVALAAQAQQQRAAESVKLGPRQPVVARQATRAQLALAVGAALGLKPLAPEQATLAPSRRAAESAAPEPSRPAAAR